MKRNNKVVYGIIIAVVSIAIIIAVLVGIISGRKNKETNVPAQEATTESIKLKPQKEPVVRDVTVNKSIDEKLEFTRQAEYLDRGLVAVNTDKGVYLSWRYLGTDDENTVFKVYRDGVCITEKAIEDSTNYIDVSGTITSKYYVEAIAYDAIEQSSEAKVINNNYFDIPITAPDAYTMIDGTTCTYSANDAGVGDVDGDGQYEIILKWEPSNAQDNSKDGYTGKVYIDAYEMDGTKLWRIDLGVNIRAGAHYTQFMVYDYDGDGKAEMVCRTADGTVDGQGNVIGDGNADYRSSVGRILEGPEYLTLFDGLTGKALDTIDYEPARGNVSAWGDDYGNRVDRFLAATAYLDGEKPSVVMCRGYYTRSVLTAYDVVDKKLVKRWVFDSDEPLNSKYAGQGNHNLAVADVDWDGKDEIVYGQCVIDDDGTGLFSTNYGHGDAVHVGDYLPERDGLEVWGCLEGSHGAILYDGATGEILLRITASSDTGRAIAGNFIPGNNGAEFVSTADSNVYDANGNIMADWSDITKWSPNYAVYWDGDLEQEVMDRTMIDKYKKGRIFSADSVYYINGTKANASLCADILGDWREEVIWPTSDGKALRVYMTTEKTDYRIYTLMHDIQYRCQVSSQNVAYNQGASLSFFLGTGYSLPKQPNIKVVH